MLTTSHRARHGLHGGCEGATIRCRLFRPLEPKEGEHIGSPIGIKLRQVQETLEMRGLSFARIQATAGAQNKAEQLDNGLKVRRGRDIGGDDRPRRLRRHPLVQSLWADVYPA